MAQQYQDMLLRHEQLQRHGTYRSQHERDRLTSLATICGYLAVYSVPPTLENCWTGTELTAGRRPHVMWSAPEFDPSQDQWFIRNTNTPRYISQVGRDPRPLPKVDPKLYDPKYQRALERRDPRLLVFIRQAGGWARYLAKMTAQYKAAAAKASPPVYASVFGLCMDTTSAPQALAWVEPRPVYRQKEVRFSPRSLVFYAD